MRRTITALVLFSATLFILQIVPQQRLPVVRSTAASGETMEEWLQTTVADFEAGQMECVVVEAAEDGELALAQEQDGDVCTTGVFTSQRLGASVLFNVVGVAWIVDKPMGTTFEAEIRTSSDGETWSDWMEVVPDEDGPVSESPTHSNLLEVPPSHYLQYRVILGTFELGVSPLLREVVLTVMDTTEGPTTEQARAMILPQESTPGVPQPRIISRKGWGANESWATREPVYEKPTHFVIHHTVTSNNPEDPAYIVRAILQYHALSRGWGDIGYNFLIDRQGNIYEGRKGGDGVVGIHAGDYNYGSIGIALLGDYRTAEMTPAMKGALVSLIAWEADRYGIHPQESSFFVHRDFPNIVGHRDLWSTVCPGDKVYKALPQIRKLVWERLLAHDPRVMIVSPEAGEAVSGEVQVQVNSPSPTMAVTRVRLDGTKVADGETSLKWMWNTRQSSEGRHRIEAVARSVEGRKSTVAREVIVDNTPPQGSISIDDGARYTSHLEVTLQLNADDGQGELVGMQFTQDSASEFTDVEEYTTSRQWSLDDGDGEKTVGVRFVDWAGNSSPTYTASIILDTEPPGDWSRVASAAEPQQVMVGVVDEASGLDLGSARYALSPDGGFTWGDWRPVECDVAEGEGQVMACYLTAQVTSGAVRFKIADQAGNESYSPAYGEVVASPTPTEEPSTTPEATPQVSPTPTEVVPPSDLPDLVVEKLAVTPEESLGSGQVTVTVTIRNEGLSDARSGFWVELFMDPETTPTLNSTIVGEAEGVLWYVPGLLAGEAVSLGLGEADERYTNFSGQLPPGRHQFYVYVDAYNTEGQVGLVAEGDESNNLLGPLVVETGQGSPDGGSEPSSPGSGNVVSLLIQRLAELLRLLRERL
jgi:hypothetical protein